MLPISARRGAGLLLLVICVATADHVPGASDLDDALQSERTLQDKDESALKNKEAIALKDQKDNAVLLNMQHVVLVFGPPDLGLGGNCRNGTNCGEHEQCSDDDGVCECLPGFQWTFVRPNQQICARCPVAGHSCGEDRCCYPQNETWCASDDVCRCRIGSTECSETTVDQFKLATQIALVSAIILVIACLLVILWRTCRKQHGLRVRMRMRAQRRSDASQTSLTSVQLRVVERLRNRPPGYHDRTHIRIEKPPSYEETVGQPLRYPALTLDPVHSPLDGAHEEHAGAPGGGGADNAAFVDDELAPKQAPVAELHM